jgi:hypothetical protein
VSEESAVSAVAALESRDAMGRGLRVEFFHLLDRYAHRVLAVGYEELPVLLLESIEGTAAELWPPSPACQAINLNDLQQDDASREAPHAAMLVGMSGSTHWSMSVSRLSKSDSFEWLGGHAGIHFDAAGRLKLPPKVLSTQYLVGKRVRVQPTGGEMLLHFGSGQCVVGSRSPDGKTGPFDLWQFEKQAQLLRHEFVPSLSQLELPATLRWSYAMRLAGD